MTPSRSTRILSLTAAVVIAAGLLALVFFLPLLAAIIFVSLLTVVAVATAKKDGKLKGVVFFLKEILFGW